MFDNYENESSAIEAMKTTLEAIQTVRGLLSKESHQLSGETYSTIDMYLSTVEYGLSQEMGDYREIQYTEAPHLYDDDDDAKASFWDNLRSRNNQMGI